MSSYLSDEEQIERLQGFIKNYGGTVLSAVLVALLAFAGYQYWQKNKLAATAKQADAYSRVVMASQNVLATPDDQAAFTKFMTDSESLIKEDPNGIYATYSLLLQAKVAVEKNDYPRAQTALSRIVDNGHVDAAQTQIAALRLARVFAAQNKWDDALKTLSKIKDDAFMATANEIKGDVLQKKNDVAGAKQAYTEAWAILSKREEERPLLKIKMAAVGLVPADITVTSPIKS